MIEFLTLFLHLMSGVHPVEVSVGPEVAAVEFVLDGTSVDTVKTPPWRTEVNFGHLDFHVLEAVALASDGSELKRVSQHINLPRPSVEARIIFEQFTGELPSRARVVWNAVTTIKPIRIDMRFDGTVIKADKSGAFALPEYDAYVHHVVIAEVQFTESISTIAEAVVGGRFGSELRTALTAVPIEFDHIPDQQMAANRIRVADRPAEIVALEQLGARIVVVQDPESHSALRRLAGKMDGNELPGLPKVLLVSEEDIETKMDLVSLVHPCAKPRTTPSGPRVLFPVLGPVSLKPKPLAWVLTHGRFEGLSNSFRKIADAVANAAVRVAASSHPGAVILILGNDDADTSQYHPAEVQAYLDSIRVPLYVWRTEKGKDDSPWDKGDYISSTKKLRAAANKVLADLKKQWIVWVEGQLTPNEIRVTKK